MAPSTVNLSRPAARHTTNQAAILAIVLISYFMILLDNSVIFTGIPSIRDGLDLDATQLSWVQDAYTLVFGGLLLLGSRAGDIVGRRRLFIAGLAVFGLASLLVGTAQTGWWLIAARALQGVGAAVVAPTSLSLITANFTGRERARAVAWYGATAGIGASLGLVVGGAAAQWISWRAGFYINVPIAVAMVVAALRFLPETPRAAGRFDTVGAICATLGTGSLVYGIVNSAENGWSATPTLVAVIAGTILLGLLVANEWHAEQPIMPLRLFKSRERSGAYAVRMLYLGAMIGFFYFTTQYLQGVLGYSPLQAGLGFLPMTAVNFAVAMSVPRLRRIPNGILLATGVLLTLLGMGWLSQIDADAAFWTSVALPMILIGAGQGLAFAPLTTAGIADVDAADAGAASGLINTAHQLGSALGLAVLVAVAAHSGGQDLTNATTLTHHVSAALTAGTVLLALALAITVAIVVPAGGQSRLKAATPRPVREQSAA
jgi:EmrB/QacA subfamily drug resistance transporter